MDLLDRLDRMIDERHLLNHPFYTKWAEGTLPKEALQEYARQYYAFESAFPRYLSTLHSRTERADVRQQLLDNLWDEEHGAENHAEMWLRFAEGIGVDREDVKNAPHNPATDALVGLYRELTREAPVAAGVAALYAYERQVPQVAGSKIEGLQKHYDVGDARTLKFFVVHGVLDVEHSDAERQMVAALAANAEAEPIEQATRQALDAWWNFLTAVDMPAREQAAAFA
ncbi:MAG TPA: CADD family putative folate metabolism protein [Candidatus Caenarcaniphilales bacterium]|nr:CADD family putative folate metabolism protein [Candidatus Caenarcaniphilales bacterium]